MTVKQLIQGLEKYHPDWVVVQDGTPIKAMRIHDLHPERQGFPEDFVVRLIKQGEKRA
jgi:hypothetical protein